MKISSLAVPVMFLLIIFYGIYKNVDIYTAFLEGCAEGLKTAVNIIPPILAIFIAINMLRTSRGLEFITHIIEPVTSLFKIPKDMVPFALLRPISGGGSLAMATDLFKQFGTDSFIGRCISVLMGSTETTLYAVTVYFSAVKIKDIKYTLKVGLLADLFGFILTIFVCHLIF